MELKPTTMIFRMNLTKLTMLLTFLKRYVRSKGKEFDGFRININDLVK